MLACAAADICPSFPAEVDSAALVAEGGDTTAAGGVLNAACTSLLFAYSIGSAPLSSRRFKSGRNEY